MTEERQHDEEGIVDVHFLKSNQFRVVHADGAFGGITPSAKLAIGFWNQRFPFPQRITYEAAGERLGGEVSRSGKQGIVREIEVEVLMDLPQARSLVGWMLRHLRQVPGDAFQAELDKLLEEHQRGEVG